MNKKTFLFSLSATALLLQGCTEIDQIDFGGEVPISLTATMEDDGEAATRAGTAVNNSFDSNDAFYAYFPSNVRVGSTTSASNTTFSYNGSAWSPATQPYFNAGTTSATVHAYYGKSGGSSGTQVTNSTTSFSVATDQSGDANYKASDLMYATTTVQKSSPTASLTFTHKMSKILVTANIGAGVTNIQGIRIIGGSRTIDISTPLSCTLGTTLSDANTTSSYITMYSGTSTSAVSCAALIPPQTINGNFLQIVTDKGTATYSLSSKQFETGKSYQLTITVNAAAIGTTIDITNWAANGNATVNPTSLILPSYATPLTLEPISTTCNVGIGFILSYYKDYPDYNDNLISEPDIYYSLNDGASWTKVAFTMTIESHSKNYSLSISVPLGKRLQLAGSSPCAQTESNGYNYSKCVRISCDQDCYIYGNVMSFFSIDNFATLKTIPDNNALQSMFYGNTHIKNHPMINLVLPATTLIQSSYYSMFYGCTGLTSAPALPATTLAPNCYYSMFQNCTGLTSAPALPATTLAETCYQNMFGGCTGLTSAPALPATTLAETCYSSMFYGCTGLTSAPALPATTMARYSYMSMFSGCTGLTSAPALPATTLDYGCYENMFYGCSGLKTAPPELPATTLAQRCYWYMFGGCTGLTSAPVLPATTLVSSCYNGMFKGCSNLSYIKAMFITTPSSFNTDNWVENVKSTGIFVKNSAATWTLSGIDGIPNGWTVQTASQ